MPFLQCEVEWSESKRERAEIVSQARIVIGSTTKATSLDMHMQSQNILSPALLPMGRRQQCRTSTSEGSQRRGPRWASRAESD